VDARRRRWVKSRSSPRSADPSDWKPLLAELHLAALNRAKKKKSFPSICWRAWL